MLTCGSGPVGLTCRVQPRLLIESASSPGFRLLAYITSLCLLALLQALAGCTGYRVRLARMAGLRPDPQAAHACATRPACASPTRPVCARATGPRVVYLRKGARWRPAAPGKSSSSSSSGPARAGPRASAGPGLAWVVNVGPRSDPHYRPAHSPSGGCAWRHGAHNRRGGCAWPVTAFQGTAAAVRPRGGPPIPMQVHGV